MRRMVLGLAAVTVCLSACSSGGTPHLATGPVRGSTTADSPSTSFVPVTTSAAPATTTTGPSGPPATTTAHLPAGHPATRPGPTTKPAAPPPAGAVVPNQAMLRAALLTPADLPGSFSVTGAPDGVADSSLAGCPSLSSDPPGATATAGVDLTDTTNGAAVTETLLQLPSASAAQAMAGFGALPTTCHTFSATFDGVSVSFTTTPTSIPPLGDASTAARLTASVAGTSVELDVVAVRHGNTVVVVDGSTNVVPAAARAAVARVAARW